MGEVIKFVDLFAGLGGFHVAAAANNGKCVFVSEIQKNLQDLYTKNFGIEVKGDINHIDISSIPSHQLLCAGFPCQPFSKAGTQKGWKDAVRGTVFLKVVEVLEYHRPEYLILENVAHFVRHDQGNTYLRVIEALESLGYEVESKKLSPHEFGIPQIRDRMYLVGRRKDKGGLTNFSWPSTKNYKLDIGSILEKNPTKIKKLPDYAINCLDAWQALLDSLPAESKLPSFPIWAGEFGASYPYDVDSLTELPLRKLNAYKGYMGSRMNGQTYDEVLSKVPSYARAEKGAFPKWKQQFIAQNRAFYSEHKSIIDEWLPKIRNFPPSLQKLEWNCQGEIRDIWQYIIQFRASGVRVKRRNTSPSLIAMTTTQVPVIAWERRYMTVKECAKLQSLHKLKYMPLTEGGAFKALGNAVNAKVVEKIIKHLINCK